MPAPQPQGHQGPTDEVRPHSAPEILLGFARALRAAGLPVTADRERAYLQAVVEVGLGDPRAVYVSGTATMCSTPQDLVRYDQVYLAWFGGQALTGQRQPPPSMPTSAPLEDDGEGVADDADGDIFSLSASAREVLRHKDIAELSAAQRQRLAALFEGIRPQPPRRRSTRRDPARAGAVDGRATLRELVRRFGEPARIHRARRTTRSRRVVLLIDVSGSMSPYADALLRLAHRFVASAGPVEVFTLGTRLTHVSRALRQPDVERAIADAGQTVPDWSGGTRLGECLAAFLRLWGRRGMARGAVVVIFSDGWEREGPDLLGEQMAHLAALAHRVVWVNPHRGKAGYQPIQAGMAAALPHCHDFLAGHSMATYEKVAQVVAHA